ncbi:MAG TPA: YeeE/YedE thiosulfate transporter family protein [Thermoanaerobaculia bacterium]|nr:YeeE/YedE thiosulfate transporter family protein [Thermoanaerobaculia bacterium]
MNETEPKFWNPYLAGIALGLVLLASFLVMGHGLGASGAATRFGQFITSGDAHVLDDWLVFEVLGVFLGGLIGAYSAGRLRLGVIRGAGVAVAQRLAFAFGGGLLMGMAARAARGCTSGQALSGGAVMSAGAWIFMLSVFAGGYGLAWFVRRQWQP